MALRTRTTKNFSTVGAGYKLEVGKEVKRHCVGDGFFGRFLAVMYRLSMTPLLLPLIYEWVEARRESSLATKDDKGKIAGEAMRVLVIEDEVKTRAMGVDGLRLVTTGEDGLVILDIMLPGDSGWQVMESLRRQKLAPVLFLTARDDVADRVRGLELGADDYLVKPFSFAELVARVRTVMRRINIRLRSTTRQHARIDLQPAAAWQ